MNRTTALTTALLTASLPTLILTYLIFADAGPIAVAIAAFGLGIAVRNAFAIWQAYSRKRPPNCRPPGDRQPDTGRIPYNDA